MTRAERAAVLREHGATKDQVAELLDYTEPTFDLGRAHPGPFPLEDEPFVAAWEDYRVEAERRGVWPCLRDKLVQLRFPIAAGIGESDAYRAATRRGVLSGAPPPEAALRLRAPERLRLLLQPTPAGRIPVLIAGDRADFISLVRALIRRNEPAPVPAAQGACVVAGYNNWDRVARLRHRWRDTHPHAPDAAWGDAFRALIPHKTLYQDRFIILSDGPYSGVPAEAVGMTDETWRECSLRIRLEHECAHYFTRRVLGSMRNSLHDELIADYMGLVLATGSFRPDWFLRFMGLDQEGRVRAGGRLASYRGDPPLSDRAFRVLHRLVWSAARGLAALDPMAGRRPDDLTARAAGIGAIAARSVEDLARLGLRSTRTAARTPDPSARTRLAAAHHDRLTSQAPEPVP